MRLWNVLCLALLLAAAPLLGETRVRLVTSNLTSGDAQSYDAGHGIRILQGLQPTVALMNEFNYGNNSPSAIRNFVTQTFGAGAHYYREPGQNSIPNGVVSLLPILSAGTIQDPRLSNRGIVWAQIDVPGTRELWVYSLHLSHSDVRGRIRAAEIVERDVATRVPKNDYLAVGGDLNTASWDEQTFMVLRRFLSGRHTPADEDGNAFTNINRTHPYDVLFPNAALDALHTPVTIGTLVIVDGLVFDSRVFSCLSAVSPVRRGDSGARGMQHLAVVKDFLFH